MQFFAPHGILTYTSVYISAISSTALDSGLSLQQYADDTQLYISVSTDDLAVNLSTLESCLQSLHSWLCHTGLALNSDKSEYILFGTSSRIRNFPLSSWHKYCRHLSIYSWQNRFSWCHPRVSSGTQLPVTTPLMFTALLIFTSALFVTSELHLLKTCLKQSPSQWFTHISVVHGLTNITRLQSISTKFCWQLYLKNSLNLSSRELLLKLHWLPIQSTC